MESLEHKPEQVNRCPFLPTWVSAQDTHVYKHMHHKLTQTEVMYL